MNIGNGLLSSNSMILLEWEKRVRKNIKSASNLSQPVLIDTLPAFLTNLRQALDINHPRNTATEGNNIAQEHGADRARVTHYGPDQIIQEYNILRQVIEEEVLDKIISTKIEMSIIQKSFDQAIQEAMTAYFLVHRNVRDQFIATLTHDLRNPLGASSMSAELIKKKLREPLNETLALEIEDLATNIVKSSRRADRMIQNLLDSNMLQVGEKLSIHLQKFEMKKIIENIVSELNDSQRLNLKLQIANVEGWWDEDLVFRALENLVSNAYKYRHENGTVTIKVEEILGRAIVTIHNDGPPIPAEDRDLLFQAFRRSEAALTSGKRGWGLGLTQARSVAESHGGSIAVDSSIDCGTTFTFDIPVDARPLQKIIAEHNDQF